MGKPLRTSNLVYRWSTMTHIVDMCSDLEGHGYNVTSSVWHIFAHNSTKTSCRNTKISRKVVCAMADIPHQFQCRRSKVKVTSCLTSWPKISCIFSMRRPASHHLQGVGVHWGRCIACYVLSKHPMKRSTVHHKCVPHH